jgi:hypothetical protein
MQTKGMCFLKINKKPGQQDPRRAVGCAMMTISQEKRRNVHTDRQQQVTMMATATQAQRYITTQMCLDRVIFF